MEAAQQADGQIAEDSIDPHGLLIGPEDFPGRELTVETRDIGNLFPGMRSPHIVLKGPDIVVHYHYAFINDAETALSMIGSVRADTTLALGLDIFDGRHFFPNSAINRMDHSTGQHITIFFAEGNIIGRVILWGPVEIEDVVPFAEAARNKILTKSGELP